MSMTEAPPPPASASTPPAGPTPAAQAAREARAAEAAERLARKLAEAGEALGAVAKDAAPSPASALAPEALLKAAPAAPSPAPKPAQGLGSGQAPAAPSSSPAAPPVARMSAPYPWEGPALEDKGVPSLVTPPTESRARAASAQVLEKVKGGLLRAAEARPPRRWRMIGGAILGVGLVALGAAALLKDRDPADFTLQTGEIRARMAQRPELAIHTLHVTGRENLSVDEIRTALGIEPDGRVSAVGFDAAAARLRLEASPWVRAASVELADSGEVFVTLDERVPAAVWQIRGEFWLIDSEGARIARVMDATERLDLPWIVGAGADRAAGEAWRLLEAAGPELRAQIGALTRVGQRRWDLELVDGRRILLPETDPFAAMRALGEMTRGAALLQRSFLELNYTNAAEGLVASLPEEAQAYRERLRAEPPQTRR
ncbi:cell division protein FtsQ/DivIB [Neomegalonema sp.]|uniref:cell division protein FtsQ/DivIB n=1 Tax=Neomegalonema sp. TaxID=2039713 RepID=UPI0026065EB9|nr:cell division protein FtsQ/DivIB [Neomegalonema sp.]MDD2867619.1 cell division protein FtsQ/DivIB [Neomegalonema sp.]